MSADRHAQDFEDIEALCRRIRQPGSGRPSDAMDLAVSPDGRHAAFAGTIVETLSQLPATRLCLVDLLTGHCEAVTGIAGHERAPRFSPDGRLIAFLSDQATQGLAHACLLDLGDRSVAALPRPEGRIEYLAWAPDGQHLLFGVAGSGADVSGMDGGQRDASSRVGPDWAPLLERFDTKSVSRTLWLYSLPDNRLRHFSEFSGNVWDACWAGSDAIAAVTTPFGRESDWYEARVEMATIDGSSRSVFSPKTQLGSLTGDPAGHRIAVIEGLASDRGHVFGDVHIVDARTGTSKCLSELDFDAAHLQWTGPRTLLVAGHRGLETLAVEIEVETGDQRPLWSSTKASFREGGTALCATPSGGLCLIADRFERAPEIALVEKVGYRTILSLDLGFDAEAEALASVEPLSWSADDGLTIEGWLLRPRGEGPAPLVTHVHGGPISHVRPMWLGRRGGAPLLAMLQRGMALFLPNPRGSAGRGQAFARCVLGDFGGADAADILAGIDHLVGRGIADPERLGVTGMSYGGYMSAWLVTQDDRFAAAVPISPVTHLVTQHLLSTIPAFTRLFVGSDFCADPIYRDRSPLLHVGRVRTPVLTIAGGRDFCTPASEAVQFHRALCDVGAVSALAIYPQDGHGVRTAYPSAIDCAARLVGWLEAHLGRARDPAGMQSDHRRQTSPEERFA